MKQDDVMLSYDTATQGSLHAQRDKQDLRLEVQIL